MIAEEAGPLGTTYPSRDECKAAALEISKRWYCSKCKKEKAVSQFIVASKKKGKLYFCMRRKCTPCYTSALVKRRARLTTLTPVRKRAKLSEGGNTSWSGTVKKALKGMVMVH